MTTHEKTPAGATNTDQGNENLRTGISTNNDTRTSPVTHKPKPRLWHIRTGFTDDGRGKGLCGWVSRPNPLLATNWQRPVDNGAPAVECPDCAEIKRMQAAAVLREQRALELAKFILNHLDEKA